MTTQETSSVDVRLTFSTEKGEIPPLAALERLVTDQMSGVLDDETGLTCIATTVLWRVELDAQPHVLVVGNPFDGFTINGPHPTVEDALDVAAKFSDSDWWAVKLELPE